MNSCFFLAYSFCQRLIPYYTPNAKEYQNVPLSLSSSCSPLEQTKLSPHPLPATVGEGLAALPFILNSLSTSPTPSLLPPPPSQPPLREKSSSLQWKGGGGEGLRGPWVQPGIFDQCTFLQVPSRNYVWRLPFIAKREYWPLKPICHLQHICSDPKSSEPGCRPLFYNV